MSDSKGEPKSLKSKLGRVAEKFSKPKPQKPRRLVTENLEARVLFSGSPASAPDAPAAHVQSAAVHEYTASPQENIFPSSLETLPAQTSVTELNTGISLSKTEIHALLTLAQLPKDEIPSDESQISESLGAVAPPATSFLFSDPSELWERSESTSWEASEALTDGQTQIILPETFEADSPTSTSTVAGSEMPSANVYLDLSILAPLGDGFQQVEQIHEERFELTLFATLATVGSISNHQARNGSPILARRNSKADRHSTYTNDPSDEESATFSISGQQPQPTARSSSQHGVDVDATGILNLIFDGDSERSEIGSAPAIGEQISLTSTPDRGSFNPANQLFVVAPVGFDFTTLQSGDHRELVREANPFLCIESARPLKDEGRKTKLGRFRKRKVSKIPLGRSQPGCTFAGDSYSIEVWIRPNETHGPQSLFSIENEFGAPLAFVARMGGAALLLRCRTADFRYRTSEITIPRAFSPDRWHHLVVVRDSTKISVIIDGVDRTPRRTPQQKGLTIFGPNVHFGKVENDAAVPSLDGTISGFSIYGYPLSSGTIFSHHNEGLASGPYGSPVRGIVGLSPGKQVFVGGDGSYSHSASALVSNSTDHRPPSVEPYASDRFEISVVQNLFDRIADQIEFTAGSDGALGVFLSRGIRRSRAEFASLNWGEAESVLDHFGVPNISPSGNASSRCLFLSGTPTGNRLEGFVAEIGDGGRIDAVVPLDLSQQRNRSYSGSELISSLKSHASTKPKPDWETEADSPVTKDSNLRRVSSVQDNVFFGSE